MKLIKSFLTNDAGAITVDWVTLTAGVLLLGIMVVYAIFNGGVSSLVSGVNSTLESGQPSADVGAAPHLNDAVRSGDGDDGDQSGSTGT